MLNSHIAHVANWTGHSRYITFPPCRKSHWRELPGSFWAFQAICDLPQWVKWSAKDVLELYWVVLRTLSAQRLLAIPHVVLSDKRSTVSQLRIRLILWFQTPNLFGSCLAASQHTHTKTHNKISFIRFNTLDFPPAINNADNVSSYSWATILHCEGFLRWRGYFR